MSSIDKMQAAVIVRIAELEVKEELFREQVEAAKTRLRERRARPWWTRLIPFKIVRR